MSTLTGREIRVGQHPCYDRFVLELQGTGSAPGWQVGYRDPLIADPSGQTVQLRGDADLQVVVRVWTVTPYPGMPSDQLPFQGSEQMYTKGFPALLEARIISSWEGVTQIGLGVDTKRDFRAFSLTDPPRLVVDIANS
jgi:hypothetical protein